jgi:hypothetical protein
MDVMEPYRPTFDRQRLLPGVRVVAGLIVLSLVGSVAWSVVHASAEPIRTGQVVGVTELPDGDWLVSFVAVSGDRPDWRVQIRNRADGGVDLAVGVWGGGSESVPVCRSDRPWSLQVAAPESAGSVFDAITGTELPVSTALSTVTPNPPTCGR